jgi:hypothetical protein
MGLYKTTKKGKNNMPEKKEAGELEIVDLSRLSSRASIMSESGEEAEDSFSIASDSSMRTSLSASSSIASSIVSANGEGEAEDSFSIVSDSSTIHSFGTYTKEAHSPVNSLSETHVPDPSHLSSTKPGSLVKDLDEDEIMKAYKNMAREQRINLELDPNQVKIDQEVAFTNLLQDKNNKSKEASYLIQSEMHKAMQKKCEKHFKPIDWSKGEVNIGSALSLKQGEISDKEVGGKTVKCRYINIEPKATSGPVHLSLALKDENGRNMKKDSALYFTVHYDKEGKLQEMTYPVPVEFDKKSGQGFIQRDGKVFTLPIDKTRFEMLQNKLQENRNQALGRKEERSEDIVSHMKRSSENETINPLFSFGSKQTTTGSKKGGGGR